MMTTTAPDARVKAHQRAGTCRRWKHAAYAPGTITIIAEIDVSGRGRFRAVPFYGATLAVALAEVADCCDALPGAYRVERRAA